MDSVYSCLGLGSVPREHRVTGGGDSADVRYKFGRCERRAPNWHNLFRGFYSTDHDQR